MTEADAYKALFARVIQQWPAKSSNVPYALEERPLQQPSPPFAVFEITNLDGDQATMGPVGRRRFLRMGFLDVRLYGARGKGRGELDTLARYVKELFEATRVGAPGDEQITTYTTSMRVLRNDREYPDLRCVLVRTAFEFYERR